MTFGFVTRFGSRVALSSPVPPSDCRQSATMQEDQVMRPNDELDGNATVPSAIGFVIDPTVEDDVEEERPDDALTCPLLDTPIHFDDCKLCHDAAGSIRATS